MRVLAATLVLATLACGARAAEPVTFGKARAVITTERARIVLDVEVARTPEQRARGLMFRRSLAPRAGMVFIFERDVSGAFWMKDTLIPLSIAFYDRRGRILRIMVMQPCRAEPCPLYDPRVAYRGALEVNKGSFGRWGVTRGDTIRLTRR